MLLMRVLPPQLVSRSWVLEWVRPSLRRRRRPSAGAACIRSLLSLAAVFATAYKHFTAGMRLASLRAAFACSPICL